MANCLDDLSWSSNVPGNASIEKGSFTITTPQQNGDFLGEFLASNGHKIPIRGNCNDNSIWFDKPANNPNHRYSGIFIYVNGVKQFMEGKRIKHSDIFLKAKDVKEAANHRKALVPDDWTGEKIT
jgi:hypothetical protein